ncbi:MAG: glycosyltransferase family 4 protein [Ruminiclostridium sp.]|nr:glycosyltransferase family 4 protein [Ruminiclostridium sp.]
MRILMLSWEYPPRIVGGISRVVHDLAQKLGEKGNEVHIVTCLEHNTPEEEKDKHVFVHRVRSLEIGANNFINWVMHLNFALLQRCIRLINAGGAFDIIHAHDWIVAYASIVLKHSFSIPLAATMHATEWGRNCGIHSDEQKYISSVEWWLAYEAWKVIVNSEYMDNEVKQVFQLPSDKIKVIVNGVDLKRFDGYTYDEEFRRNFALDSEKIIFFVGRLVNEKGAHVLLDAMPKIISNFNNVKLVIAGKGPQLEYLKKKALLSGISQKVYFTGYISDDNLSKLYKCIDVAVTPSLYEPFGIVALEGMVAQVPVVVSDTGGISEIVEHGIDGMKAYAENSNSLADSILEILYSPQKAMAMKEKALAKVERLYNWDVISDVTLKTYEDIIGESRLLKW